MGWVGHVVGGISILIGGYFVYVAVEDHHKLRSMRNVRRISISKLRDEVGRMQKSVKREGEEEIEGVMIEIDGVVRTDDPIDDSGTVIRKSKDYTVTRLRDQFGAWQKSKVIHKKKSSKAKKEEDEDEDPADVVNFYFVDPEGTGEKLFINPDFATDLEYDVLRHKRLFKYPRKDYEREECYNVHKETVLRAGTHLYIVGEAILTKDKQLLLRAAEDPQKPFVMSRLKKEELFDELHTNERRHKTFGISFFAMGVSVILAEAMGKIDIGRGIMKIGEFLL